MSDSEQIGAIARRLGLIEQTLAALLIATERIADALADEEDPGTDLDGNPMPIDRKPGSPL